MSSEGYVYLIGRPDDRSEGPDAPRRSCKIGFTRSKDPLKRLKQLQTASDVELELLHAFRTTHFTKVEKMLHRHFERVMLSGEWASLTEEEVRSFPSLCESMQKRLKFLEDNNTYYQDRNNINNINK